MEEDVGGVAVADCACEIVMGDPVDVDRLQEIQDLLGRAQTVLNPHSVDDPCSNVADGRSHHVVPLDAARTVGTDGDGERLGRHVEG